MPSSEVKPKKYTENGLCIKCQGIGSGVDESGHYAVCPVCDGMGRKYRKPRGPRKVLIPEDAAEYIAQRVNAIIENDNGYTLIGPKFITEALDDYNKGKVKGL